jgi:hypothetical protein
MNLKASIYFYIKSETRKLHKYSAYGLQYTCSNTAKQASFLQILGLVPPSQIRKILGCASLLIAFSNFFYKSLQTIVSADRKS